MLTRRLLAGLSDYVMSWGGVRYSNDMLEGGDRTGVALRASAARHRGKRSGGSMRTRATRAIARFRVKGVQ
jgi:hypothetical protein